jgi:hypothetical protein
VHGVGVFRARRGSLKRAAHPLRAMAGHLATRSVVVSLPLVSELV